MYSMPRPKLPIIVSLYILTVLIAILTVAPLSASALEIVSERTERHVLVPGTNAFFAPAPGLVLASDFSGFESRNRNIEVIVVFLDGPISSIEEGFTEASFASLGMNLLGKGDFMIDERRAVLYKILHEDGGARWGKWVMLAENGSGTLVVNAVFVSGDTEASLETEQMLKGVYMEPVTVAAARDTSPPAGSAGAASQAENGQISFDRDEALSMLAREVAASTNVTSNDERPRPASDDTSESESGDAPAAQPERRGSARIITEDGVIYAGDASAADSGGETGE